MPISLPVKVETLYANSGRDINVYYPQVHALRNRGLERYINQSIIDQTQELIDQQIGDSPETVVEMLGYYEIKNNQRQVLSLTFSNYTYHDKAAHGMTYINSLTFDLKEEKLCQLENLFKPNSNYIERLSNMIRQQIEEREIPLIEDFTNISPNQDFYIADKTLVIYFQLYELTPYVFGFPMFPISLYEIQDIIDEHGPLGRLVENN